MSKWSYSRFYNLIEDGTSCSEHRQTSRGRRTAFRCYILYLVTGFFSLQLKTSWLILKGEMDTRTNSPDSDTRSLSLTAGSDRAQEGTTAGYSREWGREGGPAQPHHIAPCLPVCFISAITTPACQFVSVQCLPTFMMELFIVSCLWKKHHCLCE